MGGFLLAKKLSIKFEDHRFPSPLEAWVGSYQVATEFNPADGVKKFPSPLEVWVGSYYLPEMTDC